MKKLLAISSASLLLAASLFGCSSPSPSTTSGGTSDAPAASEGASAAATESSAPTVEKISLFSNKIEITEQLKAYAEKYKADTGVTVDVRTAGGDQDYSQALKAALTGGEEVEIFVIEGQAGYEQYKDRAADLTGEEWVKDTDYAFKSDGKVYGYPVAIEGYGLTYNKDILDKAGIDPATLTNIDKLAEAFKTLNDKKDELKLKAPVAMAASTAMSWVTGNHNFNAYLSGGLKDDRTYIDKLLKGEVDKDRLTQYAKYVQLLFENSDQDILKTGDYDTMLADFTAGEVAFLHQGNWIDPALKSAGVTFEAGLSPAAFDTKDTDGVFAFVPSWYIVNDKSAGAAEAKKFLTALAETDAGKEYTVKEAGMISAFKNNDLKPDGPLSKDLATWFDGGNGKVFTCLQFDMPDGFGMGKLGPAYTEFAASDFGDKALSTFVDDLTAAIAKLGSDASADESPAADAEKDDAE